MKKTLKQKMADDIIRQYGLESKEAIWFCSEMEQGQSYDRLCLLYKHFMGKGIL